MKSADTTVMEPELGATGAVGGPVQGIVELPAGLLGFEAVTRYELLGSPAEAPFLWLQMVGEPGLAFLVIPSPVTLKSYHPEVSAEDAALLGLEQAQDAMVFNIVTLHRDRSATVNLKAPIVINRRTLTGKQVVPLNSAEYALQHPLPVAT
ncbi:MAG: flagellar assembly protein FliW [Verrucomicrobia bacterium]|nr:flagellar assembly protein FliW [Verrucomicrobiota bacterium]